MSFEQRDDEEWRTIRGAEVYEVSNHGRVRRCAAGKSTLVGKLLSLRQSRKDGYIPVVLSLGKRGVNRQALIHVLVAEAFFGDRPSPVHEVAHNDGDPSNNHYSNLRWATHAENMSDMSFGKHRRSQVGSLNHSAILDESMVRELRRALASGIRGAVRRHAISLGIHPKTAHDAATMKTWRHM